MSSKIEEHLILIKFIKNSESKHLPNDSIVTIKSNFKNIMRHTPSNAISYNELSAIATAPHAHTNARIGSMYAQAHTTKITNTKQ